MRVKPPTSLLLAAWGLRLGLVGGGPPKRA